MEIEGRRMRTRAFNMAKEEIIRILKEQGPKSTNELKGILENLPRLKNTRITSNRIAQYMRRKPFVVIDSNTNQTHIYGLEE